MTSTQNRNEARKQAELAIARASHEQEHDQAVLALDRERLRADIANSQSPVNVQAQLVERLPEIVAKMPQPAELRAVNIGGADSTTVGGLIAELTAVVTALREGTR